MCIDKKILLRCKSGIEILDKHPDWNVYISLRQDNTEYIDYMIQRANSNFYYGHDTSKEYIYWDNSVYGFNFTREILNILFKENSK